MVQAPVHSNSPHCRPHRNAIVDHDRRAVFDFRAIANSNMTFAAPLDLGKFGIANGVEVGFLDAGVTDDIFIAHKDHIERNASLRQIIGNVSRE